MKQKRMIHNRTKENELIKRKNATEHKQSNRCVNYLATSARKEKRSFTFSQRNIMKGEAKGQRRHQPENRLNECGKAFIENELLQKRKERQETRREYSQKRLK